MSTGWLRDLAAQATPPNHGEDTWEQKITWDRYNEACTRLSKIMDKPEMAMFLADTIDYVEAVGRYLASISDPSWAHVEAENLLVRFADLQPKQPA